MRVVLLIAATFLAAFGATFGGTLGTSLEAAPACRALTRSCSACADGKLRDPTTGLLLGKLAPLSDFACATQGSQDRPSVDSLATLQRCAVLSDSCAVCPDGQFVSSEKGNVIRTNLYECAGPAGRSTAAAQSSLQ